MVGLASKHDACAASLLLKRLDAWLQRSLEYVVPQKHDGPVATDEFLGEAERLGYASRFVLVRVEEAIDPELLPIAEQAKELARVAASGVEPHSRHAALDECLDRVADHRPVIDRQEVLIRDSGERMEAAAGSAREDDPFHSDRILLAGP